MCELWAGGRTGTTTVARRRLLTHLNRVEVLIDRQQDRILLLLQRVSARAQRVFQQRCCFVCLTHAGLCQRLATFLTRQLRCRGLDGSVQVQRG